MSPVVGIDPRGPRFAASITSVLLLVATFLALIGISTASTASGWFAYQPLAGTAFVPGGGWAVTAATPAQRALDPGFLLTAVIAVLFLWSVLSPRTAPWSVIFRTLIQPRLAPPTEREDPRPPRFAQGVGLFVVGIGLVLHLLGVPWALPIATAAAFVGAVLNAAVGYSRGCPRYLLLERAGGVGRAAAA